MTRRRKRKLDLPPNADTDREMLIGLAWLVAIIVLMMLAG